MSRERREEGVARKVVEALEPVQLIPRDIPGAPSGTHDFDIERAGVIVGALEVTMLLDQDRQELQAWIEDYGHHESAMLARNWYVALTDDAIKLPKSGKTLDHFVVALWDLEQRRVETFHRRPWVHPDEVLLPIERQPVSLAMSSPAEGVASVWLMGPSQGAAAWSGNTQDAIEDALRGGRLTGKREKLRRSEARERHLFIWIDGSLFDANVGMTLEDRPFDGAPSLPNEITTLWVAATAPEGAIVWRSSGEPWERFVVTLPT